MNKKNNIRLVSIISISFVIICWLSTYFVFKDSSNDFRGSFGGMFGGIESLFSGLAFCGIIITILQQSAELKLQREEMALQREEMRLQRNEMVENRRELERTARAQELQGVSLNRQAENLKISAKLSALNTLVNYYTEKAKIDQNSPRGMGLSFERKDDNFKKAEKYLVQIEEILNRKNI